jgi:hypothetical protein
MSSPNTRVRRQFVLCDSDHLYGDPYPSRAQAVAALRWAILPGVNKNHVSIKEELIPISEEEYLAEKDQASSSLITVIPNHHSLMDMSENIVSTIVDGMLEFGVNLSDDDVSQLERAVQYTDFLVKQGYSDEEMVRLIDEYLAQTETPQELQD